MQRSRPFFKALNVVKTGIENYAMSVIVGVENNATINPSSSSDFKIVAAHIKKSAKKKSIFFKNNK